MKKIVLLATIGILIFSCVTSNSQGEFSVPKDMTKNEVRIALSRDLITTYEFSKFSKISLTNSILNGLDLNKELSVDDKKSFMDKVFNNVPKGTEDYMYMDMYIGKYFENKKPLHIKFDILTPKKGGSTTAERVIVLQSNGVYSPLVQGILRGSGQFISLDANYADVFLIFENGMLIRMNDMYTDKKQPEFNEDEVDDLFKVNMSDTYLKDELLENDEKAKNMLLSVLENENVEANIKIAAALNLFLYYLSVEDVENAENIIIRIDAEKPAGLDESFSNVIEHEAKHMLELLKHLNN